MPLDRRRWVGDEKEHQAGQQTPDRGQVETASHDLEQRVDRPDEHPVKLAGADQLAMLVKGEKEGVVDPPGHLLRVRS